MVEYTAKLYNTSTGMFVQSTAYIQRARPSLLYSTVVIARLVLSSSPVMYAPPLQLQLGWSYPPHLYCMLPLCSCSYCRLGLSSSPVLYAPPLQLQLGWSYPPHLYCMLPLCSCGQAGRLAILLQLCQVLTLTQRALAVSLEDQTNLVYRCT